MLLYFLSSLSEDYNKSLEKKCGKSSEFGVQDSSLRIDRKSGKCASTAHLTQIYPNLEMCSEFTIAMAQGSSLCFIGK